MEAADQAVGIIDLGDFAPQAFLADLQRGRRGASIPPAAM